MLFDRPAAILAATTAQVANCAKTSPVLWAVALLCLSAGPLLAEETYLLKALAPPGSLARVKVSLEADGHLKINPDGKKVFKQPIQVTGSFQYDQKLLEHGQRADSPRRSIRYYHGAVAKIRTAGDVDKLLLGKDCRLIVMQGSSKQATLFSPLRPLSRAELELIDVPGSSPRIASLLPEKEVKIGDHWQPALDDLAVLFRLDVGSQSGVKCTLARVNDGIAHLELAGNLSGAVGGVAAELDLKANFDFHLGQRRITRLDMTIKEKRSIGHSGPGFQMTARVQLQIDPLDESPQLADQALAGLSLDAGPGSAHLQFRSRRGGFRLLHDRRWHVMVDRPELTVLRLVDRGELIAQCNISPAPDAKPGKQLSLKDFQQQVQRVLGENLGQIVDASEAKEGSQLQMLRVTAAGIVSELPIQWTYYHVTNSQGRRATFVFTLETGLVQRFAAADQTLTSSFRFTPRPKPKTQTKTPPQQGPATAAAKPKSKPRS